jgi:hypothetical protein
MGLLFIGVRPSSGAATAEEAIGVVYFKAHWQVNIAAAGDGRTPPGTVLGCVPKRWFCWIELENYGDLDMIPV